MGANGAFTTIGSGTGPGMVRLCVEGNTFAGGMCGGNDAGLNIYDCAHSDPNPYVTIDKNTPVGYCMSLNLCNGCMDVQKICSGIEIQLFNMQPMHKKSPRIWGLLYRGADLNCRPSGYESDALTS